MWTKEFRCQWFWFFGDEDRASPTDFLKHYGDKLFEFQGRALHRFYFHRMNDLPWKTALISRKRRVRWCRRFLSQENGNYLDVCDALCRSAVENVIKEKSLHAFSLSSLPPNSRPRCQEDCGDCFIWCCSALCPKVCRYNSLMSGSFPLFSSARKNN